MKTCTKCGQIKPESEFHKDKAQSSGLRPDCKTCKKESRRVRYLKNKEHELVINAKWRKANKERMNKLCSLHYRRNKHYYTAKTAKRKARKLSATPAWLDEESLKLLDSFYETATLLSEATGIPHDVDHIVPLQGHNVCGLHVPDNLQVLPRDLNLKKANKLVESYL